MLEAIERSGSTVFLTLFLCLLHTLHLFTHATRVMIGCLTWVRDGTEEALALTRLRPRPLSTELARLKKKPDHLAVIWVPVNSMLNRLYLIKFLRNRSGKTHEEIQERDELDAIIRDVERLITWAKVSGIKELSFYDERGLLKKYQYDVLESLAFTDVLGVRDSISLIPTNHDDGIDHVDLLPSFLVTYNSSDSKKSTTMRLNILSRRHGHEHLAQVTRSLVNEIRQNDAGLSLNDLNVKMIGEKICSTSIGPPDLIMVLGGRSLRFHGFPPWQLTLSEIYHGHSYSILPYRVTYREFLKAMRIFSDCEQRMGT